MEIYNLKSVVPDPKTSQKPEPKKQITDLKSGVHNPNRINVFVDGEYSFSLDLPQVVDFHLKIGKTLTTEELEKLKRASAYGKLYAQTLEWVLMRPHSVKETRDHLRLKRFRKRADYTDDDIEKIIAQLLAKHYLDDQKFAEWFIENRFLKKGISKTRLRQELAKKGIDKNLVNDLLENSSRDEAEEIKKVIAKRGPKTSDPQKLLAYLARHGFPFDLSRKLVEEYYNDPELPTEDF